MYAVSYFPSSTRKVTSVSCVADSIKEHHLTLKNHLRLGLLPLAFFGLYLIHRVNLKVSVYLIYCLIININYSEQTVAVEL